ncbi:hypothetical protein C8A03DRAFT_14997, partial [Achaetomium macrosporum]
PPQLLISILAQLPTPSLLPLIVVSHRFYSATLHILKQRLKHATSQRDHRLVLKCYHPADEFRAPHLYCNYLFTDSFDDVEAEAVGVKRQSALPEPVRSAGLRGIYSHFRPVVEDENRPADARYQRRQSIRHPQKDEPRPTIDVYLDPDELFSQLCTIPKLVQMGPKPGLFGTHVNVVDGLIRVWRVWLAAQASGQATAGGGAREEPVLWADLDRDVGLRFRVTEKDVRGEQDVLVARDDELPVAYRLEFEELLVRTSKLLETVEKSEAREAQTEGKVTKYPRPLHDAYDMTKPEKQSTGGLFRLWGARLRWWTC